MGEIRGIVRAWNEETFQLGIGYIETNFFDNLTTSRMLIKENIEIVDKSSIT